MLASYYKQNQVEAGCDEAGRGCLAGPVYAAAVILPSDYKHAFLTDSKQLSEKKRNYLRTQIEAEAIAYAVGIVDEKEIDTINILNASFLAMHRAINQLSIKPDFLLIDGNRFNRYPSIEHQCFVKGDARFLSIAAASILAKTYRDEYMMTLHEQYPHYRWDKNAGYPTQQHRDALKTHGISVYHRKSFNLIPPVQLRLFD